MSNFVAKFILSTNGMHNNSITQNISCNITQIHPCNDSNQTQV